MVFRGTITIEWNGCRQSLEMMVFRWFLGQATIGNDGFRWLSTIGPTMEWLGTIVEVYPYSTQGGWHTCAGGDIGNERDYEGLGGGKRGVSLSSTHLTFVASYNNTLFISWAGGGWETNWLEQPVGTGTRPATDDDRRGFWLEKFYSPLCEYHLFSYYLVLHQKDAFYLIGSAWLWCNIMLCQVYYILVTCWEQMDTEKPRWKRVKPSRKHKPPYQQASSIVVPKSVISSLI